MARKNLISKKFVDTTASVATFTSEELNVGQTDKGSIHIVWTGTSPDFTVTVEARNGSDKQDTWRTLSMGGTIAISGSSGEHELIFVELPFEFMRLIFTRASGTASIAATFTYKSTGA